MNSSSAEPAAVNADTISSGSGEVSTASGSNRFVVWQDETSGNFEILFRRSTDNGATWKSAVNLSNNPGDSLFPEIAVSGSNVYLVWFQRSADGTQQDVFFRRSIDNGATWESKVNLSSSGTAGGAEIVASGNNVYVIWSGKGISDRPDVYLRRSTDSGATWKSIVNLSDNVSQSHSPDIAISGSNVYVVWSNWRNVGEYEILFKRSTDGGATWKGTINLSENPTRSQGPEIAASGSNVYVAWVDGGCGQGGNNCDILFRGSANSGATWMSVKNLSNTTPEISFSPQLAISGSNVYLVWVDELVEVAEDEFSPTEIYFRRSTDGGVTWKSTINLSNNPGDSGGPKMVSSGSNVYVVWYQQNAEETASDTFFRRSTNNGATWGGRVNLSNSGVGGLSPQVAVSGSNVFVVWVEDFPYLPDPDNDEVFFLRSTDGGATWHPSVNLSDNPRRSHDPRIAA